MQHWVWRPRLFNIYNLRFMKKLLILLACGLPGFALVAQQRERTPFLEKSFARGAVHDVQVETSGGNISVIGTTSGEAKVEMYVQPDNVHFGDVSREEIQKRLDQQYDVTIEMKGSKLVAIAQG